MGRRIPEGAGSLGLSGLRRQPYIFKPFRAKARKVAALANKGTQGPQPSDQTKALRCGAGGGKTCAGVACHFYSLS